VWWLALFLLLLIILPIIFCFFGKHWIKKESKPAVLVIPSNDKRYSKEVATETENMIMRKDNEFIVFPIETEITKDFDFMNGDPFMNSIEYRLSDQSVRTSPTKAFPVDDIRINITSLQNYHAIKPVLENEQDITKSSEPVFTTIENGQDISKSSTGTETSASFQTARTINPQSSSPQTFKTGSEKLDEFDEQFSIDQSQFADINPIDQRPLESTLPENDNGLPIDPLAKVKSKSTLSKNDSSNGSHIGEELIILGSTDSIFNTDHNGDVLMESEEDWNSTSSLTIKSYDSDGNIRESSDENSSEYKSENSIDSDNREVENSIDSEYKSEISIDFDCQEVQNSVVTTSTDSFGVILQRNHDLDLDLKVIVLDDLSKEANPTENLKRDELPKEAISMKNFEDGLEREQLPKEAISMENFQKESNERKSFERDDTSTLVSTYEKISNYDKVEFSRGFDQEDTLVNASVIVQSAITHIPGSNQQSIIAMKEHKREIANEFGVILEKERLRRIGVDDLAFENERLRNIREVEIEAGKLATVEELEFALEQAQARRFAGAEALALAEEQEAIRIANDFDSARIAEELEAERIAEEAAEAVRIAEEAEVRRIAAELEADRIAEEAEARRIAEELEAKRIADELEAVRIAEELEAKRIAAELEAVPITEEAEARRIAEESEAARIAAELEAVRIAEEAEARRIAEELEAKRIADELEAVRIAEELEAKRITDELEAVRIAEEAEARRIAEESEAARIAAELEAGRIAEEAEARRIAEESEAARIAAELEAVRIVEEAEARRIAEELETKRIADELEAVRIAEELEAKRIAAELEAVRIAEEAEARRIAKESEAARIAAELEAGRIAEEAVARRIAEESEAARIAAELEAVRIAEEAEARRIAEELETKRIADELEAVRIAEELEAVRIAEEAEARIIAEELNAKRIADELEAVRITEELEAKSISDELESVLIAEEAEARRIAEESEAARIAAELEAVRIAEEAEARRIAEELEAKLIADELEAVRIAEELEIAEVTENAKQLSKAKSLVLEQEQAKRMIDAERLALEQENTRKVAEAKALAISFRGATADLISEEENQKTFNPKAPIQKPIPKYDDGEVIIGKLVPDTINFFERLNSIKYQESKLFEKAKVDKSLEMGINGSEFDFGMNAVEIENEIAILDEYIESPKSSKADEEDCLIVEKFELDSTSSSLKFENGISEFGLTKTSQIVTDDIVVSKEVESHTSDDVFSNDEASDEKIDIAASKPGNGAVFEKSLENQTRLEILKSRTASHNQKGKFEVPRSIESVMKEVDSTKMSLMISLDRVKNTLEEISDSDSFYTASDRNNSISRSYHTAMSASSRTGSYYTAPTSLSRSESFQSCSEGRDDLSIDEGYFIEDFDDREGRRSFSSNIGSDAGSVSTVKAFPKSDTIFDIESIGEESESDVFSDFRKEVEPRLSVSTDTTEHSYNTCSEKRGEVVDGEYISDEFSDASSIYLRGPSID
jgi:hypothetical protein